MGRAVWTEGTRAAELLRRVWAFWEGGGHPRFLPWHAVPCCVPRHPVDHTSRDFPTLPADQHRSLRPAPSIINIPS